MWIAIIFFLSMLVLDYYALSKLRGQKKAFIVALVAWGLSIVTVTTAALTNPTTYPQITISNQASNTIIQSFNTTNQLSPITLKFLGNTLLMIVYIQMVLIVVSGANFFLYERKKKYGIVR
jgi:hypothetical protein